MEAHSKFIAQILCIVVIFSLEHIWPFFDQKRARITHATRNLSLAAINGILGILFFSALMVALMQWSAEHEFGLLYWFSLTGISRFIVAFLLFDLWMYAWHVLNHVVPFFWRFHKVHHSETKMDVTTGLRFHPVEITLSFFTRFFILALLGLRFQELLLYETALQLVILFHHSNVALPERFDKVLRLVIVSPNMHRVHHSEIQAETDSNFSSIFSFWDRLFKTFCFRSDIENIRYGLKEIRSEKSQTVLGMLRTPWRF